MDLKPDELISEINLTTTSFVTAAQTALKDLVAVKGTILVTGGGLYAHTPFATELAVSWGAATLAISKSAQHKAVEILHSTLKPRMFMLVR